MKSLLFSAVFFIFGSYDQLNVSGFYLTLKCTPDVPKQRILGKNKKTVCLAKQPVVTHEELESVSALQELEEVGYVYFDLKLSEKGYQTLKQLSASFRTADLALVIDHTVVFVINMEETEITRAFQIGAYGEAKEIHQVHEKLKVMLGQE
jgi:hypothetical protein